MTKRREARCEQINEKERKFAAMRGGTRNKGRTSRDGVPPINYATKKGRAGRGGIRNNGRTSPDRVRPKH